MRQKKRGRGGGERRDRGGEGGEDDELGEGEGEEEELRRRRRRRGRRRPVLSWDRVGSAVTQNLGVKSTGTICRWFNSTTGSSRDISAEPNVLKPRWQRERGVPEMKTIVNPGPSAWKDCGHRLHLMESSHKVFFPCSRKWGATPGSAAQASCCPLTKEANKERREEEGR
ncbi:hypothetical protein PoB_006358000 [Plakobranchus ocellatus]|uniref:Uncharacterized protein n=1 Tax=Plakobranchus ocellatus TaxID=259542 RepID=A0AAV4CYW4_9GAST|nr:hypothetical protein PoB_006358000 [Plakobranchus ocellatus]